MLNSVACFRALSVYRARFTRGAALALLFLFLLGALAPAEAAIAFVQAHSATPQTAQGTVTVSYTSAQAAGDLGAAVDLLGFALAADPDNVQLLRTDVAHGFIDFATVRSAS